MPSNKINRVKKKMSKINADDIDRDLSDVDDTGSASDSGSSMDLSETDDDFIDVSNLFYSF